MSAVSDVVPAYRLNKEDLENFLRNKFPQHVDFDIRLARDEYNISVPQLLEKSDLDEIAKLRQKTKKRRGNRC